MVAQRTWGLTHFHTAGDRQQAQARALLRSSAQKKVWVAPVSTIGKYSQERHAAVVRTLESIPSRVVFELRDGLDDDVYDVPLEVELTVSSAWHDAEAVQRGVTLPTRVERSPTGTNVFVLVRPDAGPVVVGRTRRKES